MGDQRLQDFASPWWTACNLHPIQRGQLVRAFVPHVDLTPYTLIAEGRSDPHDHTQARFSIEQLRIKERRKRPSLPVAALPERPGEVYTVHRSKVRPAVVISTGGADVPKTLRPSGSPKWQSAPTFLVAPYYGAEQDDKRAGWHGPFLDRIRTCEYPQFLIDSLPGAKFESVLRLDHIQPIGRHHDSYEPLPHRLSNDALLLLDEWLHWLRTGELATSTALHDIRSHLMSEAPTASSGL